MSNLTAIITTIRHGEKDPSGELTERGLRQGAKKGKLTEYMQGDVLLLHSGVNRVKNTLISFAEHLNIQENKAMERFIDKSTTYQHYTSHYLQYLYNPKEKGDLFGKWDNSTEDPDLKISKFLSQQDISSEPKIYPSPKKMAVRMARIIATQIDFTTITVPEVRTNFVNGTHEPVIMSFLYYFLQDYSPKKGDFVKKIKGTVDFSEGFDIYVYQDLKSKTKVVFKFRDIKKEIDQAKLKEFCNSEEV